jgi:hypothetical protein
MARVLSSARGAMRKIWITVIASLAVHSAPLLLLSRSPALLSPTSPLLVEPVDRWAGNTAEPGSGQVYEVGVDPPGGEKPSAPAPATPPPPAPVAPATPKDAVPTLPAPKPPPPTKPRKPKPAPSASAVSSADATEPPPSGSPGKRPGDAAAQGGGNPGGGSFGAEGPGSVRDLGKAFTRAIPPACQADPAWSKLAPGDAGVLEVTISIDDTGHITGFKPAEGDAPKQLVALVKRTLADARAARGRHLRAAPRRGERGHGGAPDPRHVERRRHERVRRRRGALVCL